MNYQASNWNNEFQLHLKSVLYLVPGISPALRFIPLKEFYIYVNEQPNCQNYHEQTAKEISPGFASRKIKSFK